MRAHVMESLQRLLKVILGRASGVARLSTSARASWMPSRKSWRLKPTFSIRQPDIGESNDVRRPTSHPRLVHGDRVRTGARTG